MRVDEYTSPQHVESKVALVCQWSLLRPRVVRWKLDPSEGGTHTLVSSASVAVDLPKWWRRDLRLASAASSLVVTVMRYEGRFHPSDSPFGALKLVGTDVYLFQLQSTSAIPLSRARSEHA